MSKSEICKGAENWNGVSPYYTIHIYGRISNYSYVEIHYRTIGSVYRAIELTTGQEVAIKIIPLREDDKEILVEEVLLMKESRHPNIVNYLDFYLVEEELWVRLSVIEDSSLD